MLLEYLINNEKSTQKELAVKIGAAPSMINQYIQKLESQGYLVKIKKSSRNVGYIITKEGIERKNYLIMTYLYELLHLFNISKDNFDFVFDKIKERNPSTIYLYGAGEVAQTFIMLLNAKNKENFVVEAILDDDEKKFHSNINGYKVISPKDLKNSKNQLIIITSYTFEQQIRKRLQGMKIPNENIIDIFSR